jgi:hypothetical protein
MLEAELLVKLSKTYLKLHLSDVPRYVIIINIFFYYFQPRMGSKVDVSEISLNTQDNSSVRLPMQGTTYPQKCLRQTLLL